MKKTLLIGLMATGLAFLSVNVQAQSAKDLQAQKDAVDLTSKLLDKKIDLQKELDRNDKMETTAAKLNRQSDKRTNKYSPSEDPTTTMKDAKKTAKLLKQTESANKSLDKSNSKIEKLESDISKLEDQLAKLSYEVQVTEK